MEKKDKSQEPVTRQQWYEGQLHHKKIMNEYEQSLNNEEKQLSNIAKDIFYIRRDLDKISIVIEKDYVTKDQFEPVKRIVYGLVSIILVAVVGAVVALVLK